MVRGRLGEQTFSTYRLSGRRRFAWLVLRSGIIAATCFSLVAHTGCFWKRRGPESLPPVSTKVSLVLLPLNVPSGDPDLKWMALAAPILLARVAKYAQDLEIIPLWQSMPVAVEVAGNSRSLTAELSSFIASRLACRWATEGELSSIETDVGVLIDFIPAKSNVIPFRYQKRTRPDSLGELFRSAIDQFQRYLVVRPLSGYDSSRLDMDFWRTIAEAVDREYGWFRAAEPGKSSEAVLALSRTDADLARVLFNPSLYPGLGTPSAATSHSLKQRFQEPPPGATASAVGDSTR